MELKLSWGALYSKTWAMLFLDTDYGYEENNRTMRVEGSNLVLVDSWK